MNRIKITIADQEGTVLNSLEIRSPLAELADIEQMVTNYLEQAHLKRAAFEVVPDCLDCGQPLTDEELLNPEQPDICASCIDRQIYDIEGEEK